MQQWWNPVWETGRFWTPDANVSRVVARLGGLEWQGRYGQGTPFVLRSLSGWWTGGSWSGGVVPWENADGGVEGDVIAGGRTVSMRMLIFTDHGADQMEALDDLAGVWADTRWHTLEVEEQDRGIARQLRVSPVDLGDPQLISDTVASTTWTLSSADRRLLSPTGETATVTAGGVDLRNTGNARADLTVRLVGPLSNPGLSWPGGSWRLNASVGAGSSFVVDMARRVVRNPATGTHARQHASGTWWSLPPGVTRVSRTGSGTGRVEASWRSSWA